MEATMKFLTVLLFVAGAAAQAALHESLRTRDSVLFTFFSKATTKAYLQYSPADPKQWDIQDGAFSMDTLIATSEGNEGEYWGLAASYETGQIFVTNYRAGTLMEIDVNENELKVLFEDLTIGLQSMAYDRVTRSLYYTNEIRKNIMVIDKTFRHFTTVLEFNEVAPFALTIHVTKRLMFYSVYKLENDFISMSKIIRCDLDGKNNVAIVNFPDVIRVHGMTIDYADDRLYWTDITRTGSTVVMTSNLDGSGRKVFYSQDSGFLWGVAHYKNLFYVADLINVTETKYQVHIRYKDFNDDDVIYKNFRPRNVAIYGPNEVSRKKISNECSNSNCDQICLASSRGQRTCKCSPGYKLKSGYRCETTNLTDNYLVVADGGQKRLFQMPIAEYAGGVDEFHAIPLDDVTDEKIYAVTVDGSNGDLVWYDLDNKQIVWGSKVVSVTEGTVSSIVINPCKRTLYFASFSKIYYVTWDSSFPVMVYKVSFLSDASIRDIAFDVQRNQIYWTQYDDVMKESKVMRKDLDGGKVELVLEMTAVIKGIRIDYETYTLYVMTMITGEMYGLPLKSLSRIPSTSPGYREYKTIDFGNQLESENFLIFDFEIVNGMVYLADALSKQITRFSLKSGPSSMENYGPPGFYFATTFAFYNRRHFTKYINRLCPDSRIVTTAPVTTMRPVVTTPVPTEPEIRTRRPKTTRPKPVQKEEEDCFALLADPDAGFDEFFDCFMRSLDF